MSELAALAAVIVQQAQAIGATEAECTVSEGQEFSVSVRMGEVEELTQAGSRGAGIRVLVGQNSGSSHSSDLTPEGINRMVRTALELARITTPDPFAGLPDASTLGIYAGDLQLFDESIEHLDTAWKIAQAKEAERVALAFDPRIQNSDGGGFSSYLGERAFANTRGFVGSYRTSSCGLHASPVARDGDGMEREYWHSSVRWAKNLESAEYEPVKVNPLTIRNYETN